ncbi:MAG TPA: phosphate/phosphite/phosphonate ABC transporter substrate-binding protein [Thioalkalivibrio sp.]|nr:phosphate/phosphite/phosphonate ABC transporter substrate-binding protein [Thioalkalivibrio sp.]
MTSGAQGVCSTRWARMRRLSVALVWLCLAFLPALGQTQESRATAETLKFGLLPFASPVALFQRFAPLRDYLNEQLHTHITLQTDRDYPTHVQRIESGEYDLLLTAPHFVPIALDTGHYELLAAYKEDLATVYLVALDDPARTIADLVGRRVGTPPPEAVVTLLGKEHLRLAVGPRAAAPDFVVFPSHNAAIHAIGTGLVDAAAVSINVARLDIKQGTPVRILAQTRRFPGVGILAHKRMPQDLRDRLKETLIDMSDREDGSEVLNQMTYPGYKATVPDDFELFRAVLPQVREHLNTDRQGP